jgi:ribonuclease D
MHEAYRFLLCCAILPVTLRPMQTQYIDTAADLEDLCQSLSHADWLAVDTEFVREKTYYSQLCLVQISNGEHISLIDAVAIEDLTPLCELLESDDITKVFHSASQDLEIFYHLRGRVPEPLFDTQIAAALLGQPGQVSYAAMVEKYCDVQLDKSHSRTDWSKRPLSSAQLAYAAADVNYLGKIYHMLDNELQNRGRQDWHRELCDKLCQPDNYANPPAEAWQRVKGYGRMQPKQLVVLHALAAWREEQAQKSNLPRKWVMADDRLIDMAYKQPVDHDALASCGLNDKQLKRNGSALLQKIGDALATPEQQWPDAADLYIPSATEKKLIKALMQKLQDIATEHDIDPSYLARRKDIEKLLRGDRQLPLLQGWRYELAGKTIQQTLESADSMIGKNAGD